MPKMRKNLGLALLFLLAVLTLSGCGIATAEQLYCLPRRSGESEAFQSAIDRAMTGLEYSAPVAGEHQQTVQTADLDGDGEEEYLLFARAGEEKPLRILIFRRQGEEFTLIHTLESYGSAFDRVEYAQMDGRGGVELVVGLRLSEKLPRSVSVYSLGDSGLSRLLSANYAAFLTLDMDGAEGEELLLLRPGEAETDPGLAELYGFSEGTAKRYERAALSEPARRLRRVIAGALTDGTRAVFAASGDGEGGLVTDVFALTEGGFQRIADGTPAHQPEVIFAEDIDGDGTVELPEGLAGPTAESAESGGYLIRWYALTPDGREVTKRYTYHQDPAGWYLNLDSAWAPSVTVEAGEGQYDFYGGDGELLFTVYAFTGADRDAQAASRGRFVLLRTDTVTYAAALASAGDYAITQQSLTDSFHLVQRDWKTGQI